MYYFLVTMKQSEPESGVVVPHFCWQNLLWNGIAVGKKP